MGYNVFLTTLQDLWRTFFLFIIKIKAYCLGASILFFPFFINHLELPFVLRHHPSGNRVLFFSQAFGFCWNLFLGISLAVVKNPLRSVEEYSSSSDGAGRTASSIPTGHEQRDRFHHDLTNHTNFLLPLNWLLARVLLIVSLFFALGTNLRRLQIHLFMTFANVSKWFLVQYERRTGSRMGKWADPSITLSKQETNRGRRRLSGGKGEIKGDGAGRTGANIVGKHQHPRTGQLRSSSPVDSFRDDDAAGREEKASGSASREGDPAVVPQDGIGVPSRRLPERQRSSLQTIYSNHELASLAQPLLSKNSLPGAAASSPAGSSPVFEQNGPAEQEAFAFYEPPEFPPSPNDPRKKGTDHVFGDNYIAPPAAPEQSVEEAPVTTPMRRSPLVREPSHSPLVMEPSGSPRSSLSASVETVDREPLGAQLV